MADKIKAAIFDIGGVVVKSPFIAISQYEREHGLPANYINVALSKKGADGAFQKYERGEITHDQFTDQWTDELNEVAENNAAYKRYLARRHLDTRMVLPKETHVNGGVLFGRMMEVAKEPNECVVELIRTLRRAGYKVAALTNNFQNDATSGKMREEFFSGLFDEFVESSVVGLRKPDPKFYMHACNLLEVRPTEAVFLDDIGINLRAASGLGMAAVQVKIGREVEAVEHAKKIIQARGLYSARL
ncbi:epoxide hydrolase [Martensiomyces pterosporus]|nr:epoxide hydrolase [Martensiomyces pterosporus]